MINAIPVATTNTDTTIPRISNVDPNNANNPSCISLLWHRPTQACIRLYIFLPCVTTIRYWQLFPCLYVVVKVQTGWRCLCYFVVLCRCSGVVEICMPDVVVSIHEKRVDIIYYAVTICCTIEGKGYICVLYLST